MRQIYIYGTFSHAPNKFIYTCSAPPPYNVGHVYMLFHQCFNIVLGGGGGGERSKHFETDNSAFFKTPFQKHRKLMQLHKCPKEFFHHCRSSRCVFQGSVTKGSRPTSKSHVSLFSSHDSEIKTLC